MSLATDVRELIVSGSLEQADRTLSIYLSEADVDFEALGQLGAGLILCGRYELASRVFAKWTEHTPNNPEPWSNLGLCLSRMRQSEQAKIVLEYALDIDPEFAPAKNNLCEVYQELGDYKAQFLNALDAVRLQPTSANAFNNLASALLENGQIDEAVHAFETSLMLDPNSFEAGFNLAKIASDKGETETALRYLDNLYVTHGKANERRRELIEYLMSFQYLDSGRLKEGWEFYERGFSPLIPLSFTRGPDRKFAVPRWDGSPIDSSQTLMIWREQGIGDEIRFASLLPVLVQTGVKIILECDTRMVNTFQRSFPQIEVRSQQMDNGLMQTAHDYDFQIPIGSLPKLLMKSSETFNQLGAFLKAPPSQVAKFAQRLSAFEGKRKVGICWRSHMLAVKRNRKYTVLEDWKEILSTPDTVFVNLQYGECEDEIAEMEQALGIQIIRWNDVDLKGDLEAVLGLMQNLDLVVSVSTAVVPMAGALGKPTVFLGQRTWMLLGEQQRYPWFASVTPIIVPPTEPVAACLAKVPQIILSV
jgi:tetratricopeptide (TPR) repeat protein